MNCEKYIELMNISLDETLSSTDCADLSEHLKVCDSCRARYGQLKAIKAQMSEMEEEVPESLHASIMKNIPITVYRKTPFYKSKAFGYIIAACIVAVAAISFIPGGSDMYKGEGMTLSDGFDSAPPASKGADMAVPPHEESPDGSSALADVPPGATTPDVADVDNSEAVNAEKYILSGGKELPKAIEGMDKKMFGNEICLYPEASEIADILEMLKDAGFAETESIELSDSVQDVLKGNESVIVVVIK